MQPEVILSLCRHHGVHLLIPKWYSLIAHLGFVLQHITPVGSKPVQHVTVLNTIGSCDTIISFCVSIHI